MAVLQTLHGQEGDFFFFSTHPCSQEVLPSSAYTSYFLILTVTSTGTWYVEGRATDFEIY
jgi:hypothetical protein